MIMWTNPVNAEEQDFVLLGYHRFVDVQYRIYTMEMVFGLVLCSVFFGANADYVSKLNGTIHLPMAGSRSCGYRRTCPRPTPSTPSYEVLKRLFELGTEKISCDWRRNDAYTLESLSFGIYTDIQGSQTDCDIDTHGTFSCIPQPEGFCYAFVYLGFRAKQNSNVETRMSDRVESSYSGTPVIQILSLGRQPRSVYVELECENGEPCLENRIALMNIQYRCA